MSFSHPDSEASSEQLTFPPVRVDQSIERLDLNTLIMRSNARRSNAEEATALDESSFEFLGDSVYEMSDDEAHTASVASTTPDDVSVLTDTEEDADDDFDQEYLEGSPQPLEQSTTEAPDVDMVGGDESTLTEVQYMENSRKHSREVIELDEQGTDGQEPKEASKVIKDYSEEQVQEGVLKQYGCTVMRLTVRALLSATHLPQRKSFKILYVGLPAGDWPKTGLSRCIGLALDASPGPSRSIMRDGQLERYFLEISYDICNDIQTVPTSTRESEVIAKFDDGTQFTYSTQRQYSSAESSRVPDLVIFWYPHPRITAPEVDNFPAACKAFEKQGIMCLHVAEDRRHHRHLGKNAIGHKSLRACVEGRKTESGEFEPLEDIPIDVYTLLNLDPSQLNRHLAALDPRAAQSKSTMDVAGRSEEVKKGAFESFSEPSTFQLFALAVGALSMIVALYLIPGLTGMASPALPPVPTSEPFMMSTSVLPPASITSAAPVLSASPEPLRDTPRELTVVSPQKDFPPSRWSRREEKLVTFEIQTPNAHQFVLSPTKDFINRKSKPQLQIQVSKDAENVPVRYTRSINGTYIVDLEHEYPFGRFNVSIATHSKPLMQQSFSVDLGHNKTVVDQFIDLVKNDIAATRQEVMKLSASLAESISKGLHCADYDSSEFKKRIEDVAQRQAAALQSASAGTWMGLRKATAPVRTSTAAHRARDNAFQLRCRIEEALGLSSVEMGGKKSRSCAHVGR